MDAVFYGDDGVLGFFFDDFFYFGKVAGIKGFFLGGVKKGGDGNVKRLRDFFYQFRRGEHFAGFKIAHVLYGDVNLLGKFFLRKPVLFSVFVNVPAKNLFYAHFYILGEVDDNPITPRYFCRWKIPLKGQNFVDN